MELTDNYCEVLQVIFHDEHSGEESDENDFIKADSVFPKERVKQVVMKVPSGFSFKRDGSEDEALFKAILERTIIAVEKSYLKGENKKVIVTAIKKSL